MMLNKPSTWLVSAFLAFSAGVGLAAILHLGWEAVTRLFTLLHMVQLN